VLAPEALFLRPEEFFASCGAHATLALRGKGDDDAWAAPLPDLGVDRGAPDPLRRLQQHVATTPHRVLIVAESEGRRESLLELLRDSRIDPPSVATLAEFESGDERFAIAVAPLAQGFAARSEGTVVAATIEFVTETELFATAPGARRRRRQEQTSDVNALIKDLS
jgi:transcription-repair coupling factor (superfamily II helicase)